MSNINEIICKYTTGEATLEETNAALHEANAFLHLDPQRNTIAPDEVGRFGLLDTGTGSLDKVEIVNGHLVDVYCGKMYALCIFGGKTYTVQGTMLME